VAGNAIKRLDANTKAALQRSVARFKDSLRGEYDRMFASQPISLEDRGKEYLTIAGDPVALKSWLDSQAAIHGIPIARTLFKQFEADGEKFVDKLVSNAKDVTGGTV
jgi:hypothetical protein